MQIDYERDIALIKEWLSKEEYLPKDLDYVMLKKFVHSCYGSLEQTKKCIERFCEGRYNQPELYSSRDPKSAKLQTAFSITKIGTYVDGDNEVLIHELDDPNLEKFDFYDVMKSFTLQADVWLNTVKVFPEGHILLLNIKNYYLKILPRVNVFYFREFLLFLLEGMPVRIKQIHVFNCPSYYEKLYMLIKPVLPQEVIDVVHFHPDIEGVYAHVNKKCLPVELGGEAQSLKEQHDQWVELTVEKRKVFLDDNLWKADLKKKAKSSGVDTAMDGSFRTLAID